MEAVAGLERGSLADVEPGFALLAAVAPGVAPPLPLLPGLSAPHGLSRGEHFALCMTVLILVVVYFVQGKILCYEMTAFRGG